MAITSAKLLKEAKAIDAAIKTHEKAVQELKGQKAMLKKLSRKIAG